MAVTGWLINRSAYLRMQMGQMAAADEWNARIERGLVRLSTITRLEIGFSARSGEAGLTVLAVDKDFDLIADVTGQPVETLDLR